MGRSQALTQGGVIVLDISGTSEPPGRQISRFKPSLDAQAVGKVAGSASDSNDIVTPRIMWSRSRRIPLSPSSDWAPMASDEHIWSRYVFGVQI